MSFILGFTRAIVVQIDANDEESIAIPANHVWKIESAGIAGTNGTIYLKNATEKLSILFTTISKNDYSSPLPFWLDETFTGTFRNENENGFKAVVSVTEYHLGP